MAGDGIYSHYLTGITLPGWYKVIVTMRNMNMSAFTVAGVDQIHPQPSAHMTPPCCGSGVRVPEHRRRYLGYFNREVTMDLFISKMDVEKMRNIPPARIKDLSITEFKDSPEIFLTWTVPEYYQRTYTVIWC